MLGKFFGIYKLHKNQFLGMESEDKSKVDLDDSLEDHPLFLQMLNVLNEPNAIEVYLNSFGCLTFLTDRGQINKSSLIYTPESLVDLVWRLSWASKTRLDPYRPYAGGVVPGYSLRWHVVVPPLSPDGPNIVFRKQRLNTANLDDFILENFSRLDLFGWIQKGAPIVFHGSTGSGKTTALFASMRCFFQDVRVGILESIQELPLVSNSWFRLVEVPADAGGKGGVSVDRLKCEILRMSPQKIVIGEVRDSEAHLWAELVSTGHGGIMTTLHAGSHADAGRRLSNLLGSTKNQLPDIIGVHVSMDLQGQHHCRALTLN